MVVRIARPAVQPINPGILSCEVWPTHVGLCETNAPAAKGNWFLREPARHIDYKRGSISWETDKVTGQITGHARVYVPKGIYTHIVFATAEVGHIMDVKQREHPIDMPNTGWVDVVNIRKSTVLPRGAK
jgi:hypothetical protein